jgi:hypothetical protein
LEGFPFNFDLETGQAVKLGKKFNSKEKQFVRNRLWLPVYESICKSATPVGKIKYLCLPGVGCNFIKQLLGLKFISKDQTTIVAIERNKTWHKMIFEYFAENFELGKYEVLEGDYGQLIREERLIKWFLQKPFGLDIIELDFPTPLFSIGLNRKAKLLEAIAKTIEVQDFLEREFYLIVAFKAQNSLGQELQEMYENSTAMLKAEVLQKENLMLKDKTLEEVIGETDSASADERCSLFAMPLAIIRRCEGICNVTLHSPPYIHISKSVNATTSIISYVFHCKPRNYTFCAGQSNLAMETKASMLDAIKKIKEAVSV